MRLLRCKSNDYFKLATFTDKIPPYAILSITWTDGKITCDELVAGAGRNKANYTRIRFYGERAVQDSL
jgi:hypothetical protein